MCIYSVVLIFDLFFGLQRVTGCLTFASNIVVVRNVVAQQRPFEQTTDAFNPIGRQTESEKNLHLIKILSSRLTILNSPQKKEIYAVSIDNFGS